MATIDYLTTIEFENGAIAKVGEIAAKLGMNRPLIVTDPGLAGSPMMDSLRDVLQALPSSSYTRTPPNPTELAVEQALEVYKENRCDGVIALGGGSSIDLGKAVALLATHPGPIEEYAVIRGGMDRITPAVAPVIAIPTTAGTGSEVGRAALISLRSGEKLGIISRYLIPKYAVCDPELTLGLPAALTAATGMDALTHCIETYLSPKINPIADAIALDGISRAVKWIRRAYEDGSDLEARWNMMMASLQGGLTFQKGLGAVHSMSHPLGGLKELTLHHGTLNAVILPTVLKYNEDYAAAKYLSIKSAVGLQAEDDLAHFIQSLNQELQMPVSLRQMGVTDEIVQKVLPGALADHSTPSNPRPLKSEDFENLFNDAMNI